MKKEEIIIHTDIPEQTIDKPDEIKQEENKIDAHENNIKDIKENENNKNIENDNVNPVDNNKEIQQNINDEDNNNNEFKDNNDIIENNDDNLEPNNSDEIKDQTENIQTNEQEPKNDSFESTYGFNDNEVHEKSKFKILFEKFLFSLHNQLLKFLPTPYDYLFMIILGYLFMSLFIKEKKSANVKKQRRLINPDVFAIEQKLNEISKLQDEMNKGITPKKENKKLNINNVIKENINIEKLENIERSINKIMNDLNERNKENSQEKSMITNICDIQTKLIDEVTKNNEEQGETEGKNNKEDDEEEEEEDDQ